MADWYVLAPGDREPQGPGTTEQLLESLASGKIAPSSQVCRVGETAWSSIAAVPEFRDAVRRVAPPPPMPAAAQPWSSQMPPTAAPVFVPVAMPMQMRIQTPPKSRGLYIALALFLGGFGIHNFYAGYFGRGGIQLGIALLIGWTIIPLFFLGIWILVECFATKSDANGVAFG